MITKVQAWIDATFVDLARQMRWSFLPPLMVYFAAGLSGATAIVGTFFGILVVNRIVQRTGKQSIVVLLLVLS